jgi:CO/xanthine dehydrogenase Mo-binding subunit
MIDEFCELLGKDPLEFRLMNASKEGDLQSHGVRHPKIGCIETVEAARSSEHYRSKLTGPYRGRGVASGYWLNVGFTSSVAARLNGDGTVTLTEGSTDIGGTRTSVAMQLAETLGIRAEEVLPAVVDTESVGYTEVTGGSRVTFATGWAAYEAGQAIKKQLIDQVAKMWKVNAERVIYRDGIFSSPDSPEKKSLLKNWLAHSLKRELTLGVATRSPPRVWVEPLAHI